MVMTRCLGIFLVGFSSTQKEAVTSWRYTETLEGALDIVADGPSDVPPQGNWPAFQDDLWKLLVSFERV